MPTAEEAFDFFTREYEPEPEVEEKKEGETKPEEKKEETEPKEGTSEEKEEGEGEVGTVIPLDIGMFSKTGLL